MTLYRRSQSQGPNSNSGPTINWAEGQGWRGFSILQTEDRK